MVAHRLSDSIDLSARRRPGAVPGACPRNAPLAEPLFVGLDVSKARVDINDGAGRKPRVANEAAALTDALKG